MRSKFSLCVAASFFIWGSPCLPQDPSVPQILCRELTVSVNDQANIPAGLLAAAEEQARTIFLRAGVESIWLNCYRKEKKQQLAACNAADSNHVVVKILPHAMNERLRYRTHVLGMAALGEKGDGSFCYVFYDRVQRISEERKLGHSLLADVLAHEIGHLALGSGSHSVAGLMSGQWSGDGLRRVSEGGMFFDQAESRIMRKRLAAGESCLVSSGTGD